MEKEFALYPEAFELKQLGFDEVCFGYYNTMGFNRYFDNIKNSDNLIESENIKGNWCTAPIYSQAFRFFREKHGLHSEIRYVDDVLTYSYLITKIKTNTELEEKFRFTYEEAELACLRKLIEIVKNK